MVEVKGCDVASEIDHDDSSSMLPSSLELSNRVLISMLHLDDTEGTMLIFKPHVTRMWVDSYA